MRLYIFAASVVLSLFLGFFALNLFWSSQVVIHGGYIFILTTFIIFVVSLYPPLREAVRSFRFTRQFKIALLVIAGCTGFLIVQEPFGFKVIMDEMVLLGTSMMMHAERVVLVPSVANSYGGSFEVVIGYLDKRPYFHPFLISILHDLTGFRPANAFALNVILTPLLLGLIYAYGKILAGARSAILAVLLFTSLPLLAQNVTGGHFEILNMVMILATMYLGYRYLSNPVEKTLTPFCYSALLLIQTRYESAVFVLPVGVMVLLGWARANKVVLSWPVVFAPLQLICMPMQFRVFLFKPQFWQLDDRDSDAAFGIHFFGDNLKEAWEYLFAFGQERSNSLLLSAAALVGLGLFLVYVLPRLRTLYRENLPVFVLLLFTMGVLITFGIAMGYHWGGLTDPVASRFCLSTLLISVLAVLVVLQVWPAPFLLGIVVATGYAAWFYIWDLKFLEMIEGGFRAGFVLVVVAVCTVVVLARRWDPVKYLTLLTLGFIVLVTVPVASNHRYSQSYTPATLIKFAQEFIDEHPEKDYFYVSKSPLPALVNGVAAANTSKARSGPEIIAQHIKHHNYSACYALQMVEVDYDTGEMHVVPKYDLGPDYDFEVVKERRLVPLQLVRIVRFWPRSLSGESLETDAEAAAMVENEIDESVPSVERDAEEPSDNN